MAAKEVMTPDHARWEEFCNRLSGPEACDFKADPVSGFTWKCKGGMDKTFAEAILPDFDVDVPASLAFFESHGGHCDCEILFNVENACGVGS